MQFPFFNSMQPQKQTGFLHSLSLFPKQAGQSVSGLFKSLFGQLTGKVTNDSKSNSPALWIAQNVEAFQNLEMGHHNTMLPGISKQQNGSVEQILWMVQNPDMKVQTALKKALCSKNIISESSVIENTKAEKHKIEGNEKTLVNPNSSEMDMDGAASDPVLLINPNSQKKEKLLDNTIQRDNDPSENSVKQVSPKITSSMDQTRTGTANHILSDQTEQKKYVKKTSVTEKELLTSSADAESSGTLESIKSEVITDHQSKESNAGTAGKITDQTRKVSSSDSIDPVQINSKKSGQKSDSTENITESIKDQAESQMSGTASIKEKSTVETGQIRSKHDADEIKNLKSAEPDRGKIHSAELESVSNKTGSIRTDNHIVSSPKEFQKDAQSEASVSSQKESLKPAASSVSNEKIESADKNTMTLTNQANADQQNSQGQLRDRHTAPDQQTVNQNYIESVQDKKDMATLNEKAALSSQTSGKLPNNKISADDVQPNPANSFEGQFSKAAGSETMQINPKTSTPVIREFVIDQVAPNLSRMLQRGETRIEMQLYPRELGSLKVEVLSSKGIVTANFRVENQEVRQIVETALPELKQALEKQGVEIDQIQVSVHRESQNLADQSQHSNRSWKQNDSQSQDEETNRDHRESHSRRQGEKKFGYNSREFVA